MNKLPPLSISVIIPTFNRAQLLLRALESVTSQTQEPLEIIVIDDGSTDDTLQRVKDTFAQVKLISQANAGVSAARNRGIREARGDWIALLDSDDCWAENKLSRQIEAITRYNSEKSAVDTDDCVLCHTNEIWIRNGKRVNPMKKHEKKGGQLFDDCLALCVISPSSVMIRKSLIDEIGNFDETLPACEDYDLWLRICARYPALYIDELLTIKHGGHEDQLSRKHWGMDRFRVQALAKIIGTNTLNTHQDRGAREMLHHKCHILSQGASKHENHAMVTYCKETMARFPL